MPNHLLSYLLAAVQLPHAPTCACSRGSHPPHSRLTHSQNTLRHLGCTGQVATPSLCLTVGISSLLGPPLPAAGGVEKDPPHSGAHNLLSTAAGPHSAFRSAPRTMCHSRSSLPTMTVLRAPTPVSSTSPGPRRGSGPEIFTFDPLPEPAVAPAARPSASRGHRKRSRRVLYPRVVSVVEVGSRRGRGNGRTPGSSANLSPLLSLFRSGASCQSRIRTLPKGSFFSCSPSSSARS